MIITTTPSIQGKEITRYHGLVFGEVILGANAFKDFKAGLTNIFGGRSGAYEKELQEARLTAIEEMRNNAEKTGADAVVGVQVGYEVIGLAGNNMLMVTVCGTAVSV